MSLILKTKVGMTVTPTNQPTRTPRFVPPPHPTPLESVCLNNIDEKSPISVSSGSAFARKKWIRSEQPVGLEAWFRTFRISSFWAIDLCFDAFCPVTGVSEKVLGPLHKKNDDSTRMASVNEKTSKAAMQNEIETSTNSLLESPTAPWNLMKSLEKKNRHVTVAARSC